MNMWIRLAAISICSLAAGCGGGGGGRGSDPVTPTGMGMEDPPAPVTPVTPVTPQSMIDVEGLYAGSTINPDDPNNELFTQVLITADGNALMYVLDIDADSTTVAVIEGRVTTSGSDAVLTQATAFITDESPSAVGVAVRFQTDTDPNDDIDLRAQLTVNGDTISFDLESFPSVYMKPSSLEAIAGSYGQGDTSDSTVMIDSAGNVIVTQDSATGCGATGQVTIDMPAVNAYALSLQVTGCADPTQNGRYRGRLSLADLEDGSTLIVLFAHSDTVPLLDQRFVSL